MVAMTAGSSKQFDMGRVIERTVGVIGANLVPFGAMAFVLAGAPYALMTWGQLQVAGGVTTPLAWTAMLGGFLIYLVGYYVLQAAAVRGALVDLNGQKPRLGDCLATGARYFLPLLGLALLTSLALMAGALLLIVPALILMAVWMVTVPVLVTERTGVFGAFKRSAQLTKGHRWPLFGLAVGCWIVGVVLAAVFGGVFGVIVSIAGLPSELLHVVVKPVVHGVATLFGTVGVAAAYYELRTAKEGVGAAELAAVFD